DEQYLGRLVRRTAGKRWMISEQLVEHRTKSINIRGIAEFCVFTGSMLRRHVTGCAQRLTRARDCAFSFDQSRQAKVGQLRFAFCIEQNIPRFNISMQNPVFVRVMHSARDLCDQFRRLPDRYRRALDYLVKLTAFYELHAAVTSAFALAALVAWNYARIVE